MDLKGVEITWFGHATFSFRDPGGTTVLVDPWVMNNPACPKELHSIDALDVMLITHGHFDHINDAVEIATNLQPQVVAILETGTWLESKGVSNVTSMNKGGTVSVAGVEVTMTHAVHSCGIYDAGNVIYGGEAASYVFEMPCGLRVYHAGDTMVFGDMAIIGELFEPDVCLLPIGDFYTMSPKQAAHAVKLLGTKSVIPMHFGTFPILTGTPDELRSLVASDVEVASINPGETLR